MKSTPQPAKHWAPAVLIKGTAVLASVAMLAACGSSGGAGNASAGDAESNTGAALIEAAQKEGSVTIVSPGTNEELAHLADLFHEAYGIDVNYVSQGSSELAQKIEAEVAGDAIQTDVVATTLPETMKQWSEKGMLQSIPIEADGELREGITLDGPDYYVYGLTAVGLAYNDEITSSSDIPTTWKDFAAAKPKKLQLTLSDPNSTGTGVNILAALADQYGEQIIGDIATSYPDALITDSSLTSMQFTLTGEADINLTGTTAFVLPQVAAGEPLVLTYPKGLENDAVVAMPSVVGALKGSPHPNAAKLLVQFLTGHDYQVENVKDSSVSIYSDIEMPPGAEELEGRAVMVMNVSADQTEAIRSAFTAQFG